jgi:hypothetical protein
MKPDLPHTPPPSEAEIVAYAIASMPECARQITEDAA